MPLKGGVGVERGVVAPGQWLLAVEGRSLYVSPFQRGRCNPGQELFCVPLKGSDLPVLLTLWEAVALCVCCPSLRVLDGACTSDVDVRILGSWGLL